MYREKIRPGKGAQILPKLSECIPKATKSNPTTVKNINAPITSKVGPK